jgi:hypothetical protein
LFGDGSLFVHKGRTAEGTQTPHRCPPAHGVFAPCTSIPTSLLFFDRSGPTREVWYYEQPLPAQLAADILKKEMSLERICAQVKMKRKQLRIYEHHSVSACNCGLRGGSVHGWLRPQSGSSHRPGTVRHHADRCRLRQSRHRNNP